MFRKKEHTSVGVPIEAETAKAAGTDSMFTASEMTPQNSLKTPTTSIASKISRGCWVPWVATELAFVLGRGDPLNVGGTISM